MARERWHLIPSWSERRDHFICEKGHRLREKSGSSKYLCRECNEFYKLVNFKIKKA